MCVGWKSQNERGGLGSNVVDDGAIGGHSPGVRGLQVQLILGSVTGKLRRTNFVQYKH